MLGLVLSLTPASDLKSAKSRFVQELLGKKFSGDKCILLSAADLLLTRHTIYIVIKLVLQHTRTL